MPLAAPRPHPVGHAQHQRERRGPSPWSSVLQEVLPTRKHCQRHRDAVNHQSRHSDFRAGVERHRKSSLKVDISIKYYYICQPEI
jgi:hypothetical protein